MELIKLTAVPNPEIDDGAPYAVYIDATRVLYISRGTIRFTKEDAIDTHRAYYDKLYAGSRKLAEMVNAYVPAMDDPTAVGWMMRARETSQAVQEAYTAWARAYQQHEQYDRQSCTEIQLACGTALEHGVMLTRIWVQESPENVAELVAETKRRDVRTAY